MRFVNEFIVKHNNESDPVDDCYDNTVSASWCRSKQRPR
jgi:hypothetical protein